MTDVVRSHEPSHQQKRSKFDSKQVRLIQRNADFLRWNGSAREPWLISLRNQQESDFCDQERCQDGGARPYSWTKPLALQIQCFLAKVEHHDHKNEKHHDRPRVDDDFERRHERRSEQVKHESYSKQRNDQVEQGMNWVETRDRQDRRQDRYRRRNVEDSSHLHARLHGMRS